ncbi:MAG: Ig-like domain-containing protein [Thermoplasmata archaeon]
MVSRSNAVVLLLVLVLMSPVMVSHTAATVQDGDLYIESIVVVQVIKDPRIVVVNKSAALCVTVINAFNSGLRANISVTYNYSASTYLETGPDGKGVPLEPGLNVVYIPGGGCTANPEPWLNDSSAFVWTSPGVDSAVGAQVDPDDVIAEIDETNNVRTTDSPVNLLRTRSLRILVQPVYNGYAPPINLTLTSRMPEEIQEIFDNYPVSDNGISVVEAPGIWRSWNRYDLDEYSDIAASFSADARILGYDRVITVFDRAEDAWGEIYGSAVSCLNEPRDPVPLYVTAHGMAVREALIAHELGHTYYLWHPHDLGLKVYDSTQWSVRQKVYDLPACTLMCYPTRLPAGVPTSPRYVDFERYENHSRTYIDLSRYELETRGTWEWNLVSQFAPVLLVPITVVQAKFLRDGTVLIDKPWFGVPMGIPDEQLTSQWGPPGKYSVRMLDISRKELGRTYFNVSFTKLVHHEELENAFVTEEVDSIDVVISAETKPGTRYVQIVDLADKVLAERTVTPKAPVVTLLSPNGPEEIDIGKEYNITWSAVDEDGDGLTHAVAYSPDGGASWIPVANNVTESYLIWNTTGAVPAANCLVKVMATDGFNTGEDTSDSPFEMVDNVPPVTRLQLEGIPGENGWFISPVNISLFASDNSRVSRTEYSFDNASWTEYLSGFRVSDEGNGTLYYRAKDIAGNIEPAKCAALKIDLRAPSLVISYPANGSKVRGDVVFSWNATDSASGIARYEVRLNSGDWVSVGLDEHWSAEDILEGANTFEVRATDVAGRESSSWVEFSYAEEFDLPLWVLVAVAGAVLAVVVGALYYARSRSRG